MSPCPPFIAPDYRVRMMPSALAYLFLRYASHNGVQFTKTQETSTYTQADASQVLHTKNWYESAEIRYNPNYEHRMLRSGDIEDVMLECDYSLNHTMPIDASGNVTGEMLSPVYSKGVGVGASNLLGSYDLKLLTKRNREMNKKHPTGGDHILTITDSWRKYTRGGVDRDYIYTLAKTEKITAFVPRCPFKMADLMFRYAITSEAQTKQDCAGYTPNLHTVNPYYDKAITDAKTLYTESLPDIQNDWPEPSEAFWSNNSSAHILDDSIVLPSKGAIVQDDSTTTDLAGLDWWWVTLAGTFVQVESVPPVVPWVEAQHYVPIVQSNFNLSAPARTTPSYSGNGSGNYLWLAVLDVVNYHLPPYPTPYNTSAHFSPSVLPVHERVFDVTHPEIENVVEYYYSSDPITAAEIHDDYDYETVLTDPRWKKLELPEGTTDTIYAMIIKSTFRKSADGYVDIQYNDDMPFYTASTVPVYDWRPYNRPDQDPLPPKAHIWGSTLLGITSGWHVNFGSYEYGAKSIVKVQQQNNPTFHPFTNLRSNNGGGKYYADDPLPYYP